MVLITSALEPYLIRYFGCCAATGIHNSVRMDCNPNDGMLWFTHNQNDGMGDDF